MIFSSWILTLKTLTFSVCCAEGKMTVGCAVSTEVVLAGLDSSMEREAMLADPVGAKEAGMPVGGCCFFLIMSL